MDSTITCIFCHKTCKPTNEHIVPEFLGGSLIIKDVCKKCNSEMGSAFEGPLSKSVLFRLPRHIHNIQGKSSAPINAFPNTGQTEDGSKVRIDSDFKPYIVTKTEEKQVFGGGFALDLTVDVSDEGKIPQIIETKIRRMLKKENPNMPREEVDTIVRNALESLPSDYKVETYQPTIKYSESMDFNHLNFLMMKIAYEIAFYHHGSNVLLDKSNIKLRKSIYERNTKAEISGRLYPKPDPFAHVSTPSDCHCLVLCRNICYIRLFDITAIIQVCDEESNFFLSEENWTAYWFKYTEKTWVSENYLSYLSK